MLSLVVLFLGVTLSEFSNGQKKAEAIYDLNGLSSSIAKVLFWPQSCQRALNRSISSVGSLAGAQPNTILNLVSLQNVAVDGSTSDIATVQRRYGLLRVQSLSFRVLSSLGATQVNNIPHTAYKAELILQTENQSGIFGAVSGSRTKSFPIALTVNDASGVIAGCYQESQSTDTTEAACEMLGGTMEAIVPGATPRCTALDPTRQPIDQAVLDRVSQVSELNRSIAQELSAVNQSVEATDQRLRTSIQVEANRLIATAQGLDRTNSNMSNTEQNLVQTNRDLASTNEQVRQTQAELAQKTNLLSAQIDLLEAELRNLSASVGQQLTQLQSARNSLFSTSRSMDILSSVQSQQASTLASMRSQSAGTTALVNWTQDRLNQEISAANSTLVQIWTLQSQIQYIEWNLSQPEVCPLGRNQWGNCNELCREIPDGSCTPADNPGGT